MLLIIVLSNQMHRSADFSWKPTKFWGYSFGHVTNLHLLVPLVPVVPAVPWSCMFSWLRSAFFKSGNSLNVRPPHSRSPQLRDRLNFTFPYVVQYIRIRGLISELGVESIVTLFSIYLGQYWLPGYDAIEILLLLKIIVPHFCLFILQLSHGILSICSWWTLFVLK